MGKFIKNESDTDEQEEFYEVGREEHQAECRQVGRGKVRVFVEATEFSGKEDEDVDDWLYHFERVAVANGWSQEDRFDIAPAFLRGYASKWFRSVEMDTNKPNTWKVLKSLIEKEFRPVQQEAEILDRLIELKQEEKQPVRSFITKFKEIISNHDGITEEILIYFFVKALRTDLREKVKSTKPSSLKMAFEIAVEKEGFITPLLEVQPKKAEKIKKDYMEDEISNLTKLVKEMHLYYVNDKKTAEKKRICFICKGDDHYSNRCPEKKKDGIDQSGKAQPRSL